MLHNYKNTYNYVISQDNHSSNVSTNWIPRTPMSLSKLTLRCKHILRPGRMITRDPRGGFLPNWLEVKGGEWIVVRRLEDRCTLVYARGFRLGPSGGPLLQVQFGLIYERTTRKWRNHRLRRIGVKDWRHRTEHSGDTDMLLPVIESKHKRTRIEEILRWKKVITEFGDFRIIILTFIIVEDSE